VGYHTPDTTILCSVSTAGPSQAQNCACAVASIILFMCAESVMLSKSNVPAVNLIHRKLVRIHRNIKILFENAYILDKSFASSTHPPNNARYNSKAPSRDCMYLSAKVVKLEKKKFVFS
jgi:hypothetical protein